MTTLTDRRFIDVKEAAVHLGLHPMTVYMKIAAGEIPAYRLGGKGPAVRLDVAELDRWIHSDPQAVA